MFRRICTGRRTSGSSAGRRSAGLIVYPALWIVFKLLGQPISPVNDLALLVGYGPLLLSFATLVLPVGGWFWGQQIGGRSPSERERLVTRGLTAALHRPPSRRAVKCAAGCARSR
jgi:hypothetical protein